MAGRIFYSLVQVLPVQAPEGETRTLDERTAHWERALVGQLARQVHADGRQFIDWPKARRRPTDGTDETVDLIVAVRTEPRAVTP